MLNNRLMACSAPVTWVGAPRALGARPPSSLQRASVRARCSAQPSPQPQPPGKARLSSAGLHIAGDVSLHIGTLNLHMSPSAPIAATAAAPTTSALPARASNQAPAAPLVAAPPPLALLNPSTTTSPYTCIAVLEHPPRPPTSDEASDICALAISSDGRKCLFGHEEHDALWWDLSLPPRKQATEVPGLDSYAKRVAMSHDGMRVVLGSGCEVQLWDAASGDSRWLDVPGAAEEGVDDERCRISCVAITGDGKYAAAGGYQLTNAYQPTRAWLSVWDVEEGRDAPLAVINLPDGQAPTALSISSDGRWVTAITHQDCSVTAWSTWRWEVGSKVLGDPVVLDGAGFFDQSAMSYDGRTAVAYMDEQVQVWDLTTGTLTATLEGHTEELHAASISADGLRAVSGGVDCLVKVWDLESKTCLATLEGHNSAVREAALSTDGKHVVSATFMGVMRVWQLGV